MIEEIGWTSTDDAGRFRVGSIRPGTYACLARGPDGAEADGTLAVPGSGVELRLGLSKPKAARKIRR